MKTAVIALFVAGCILAVSSYRVAYRGVSVSGLEFQGNTGWYQQVPYLTSIDYFAARKANVIRLPFRWDLLQQPLNLDYTYGAPDPNSWDPNYIGNITAFVNRATGQGMTIILDLHQYAKYPNPNNGVGQLIKSWTANTNGGGATTFQHFHDFWQKLAGLFKSNSLVWFGLMNEPSPSGGDYSTFNATDAYNLMLAGIQGVRASGATNKVLVSGTVWTSAHDWTNANYQATFYTYNGMPTNGDAFSGGFPGYGDWAIDVHTYLDANHAGSSPVCHPLNNSASVYNDPAAINTYWNSKLNLDGITKWADSRNFQLFLGEVGWGPDLVNCSASAGDLLQYLDANSVSASGPWLGWAYWSSGAHVYTASGTGTYCIEPLYNGSQWGCFPDTPGTVCTTTDAAQFNNTLKPLCYFYDPINPAPQCSSVWSDPNNAKTGYSGTTHSTYLTQTTSSTVATSSNAGGSSGGSSGCTGTATCSTSQQYQQCGGQSWTGATCCPTGFSCVANSLYYSQCLVCSSASTAAATSSSTVAATSSSTVAATSSSTVAATSSSTVAATSSSTSAAATSSSCTSCSGPTIALYGNCSGSPCCCASPSRCVYSNPSYSQCLNQ